MSVFPPRLVYLRNLSPFCYLKRYLWGSEGAKRKNMILTKLQKIGPQSSINTVLGYKKGLKTINILVPLVPPVTPYMELKKEKSGSLSKKNVLNS